MMMTITGRVVIAGTQTPLPNAFVWAQVETAMGDIARHTRTDAVGVFVLPDLPSGPCTVRAQVDVARFFFSAVEGPFDLEGDRVLTLEIESKGCVAGSVNDATTGAPIRGAVVQLLEPTGGQFRAATGADGSFSLAFLTPRTYTLTCSSPGFETFTSRIFVPDALQARVLSLPLFLSPSPVEERAGVGIVRGFVYNEMGNPARNAEVTLIGEGQKHMYVTTRGHFDHELGSYEFSDIPAGNYKILVIKQGMVPTETTVHVTPGRVNWAPDIRLMASPYLTPPELEYLRLEPRVLTVGDPLRISLKVRRDLGRSPTASASIWGQGGWNTGFTIDKREPDGSLSRTLDRWPQAGFFTLSQLLSSTETPERRLAYRCT
jgi:hypothetical protein